MNKDLPVSLLYISPADQSPELIDKLNATGVQFLNYLNSIEALQFLQTNRVSAVLIEHPLAPVKTEDTLFYLRGELKINIPIYIFDKSGAKEQLPENSGQYTLLTGNPKIEELFHLFGKFNSSDQSGNFSLVYLKEISDNNEDFLLQSIEIFIDSVRENLDCAEAAYKKGEFERVGEIAHAIKPSFEMLENKEASPICDELTYNRNTEKIPSQLLELRRIYENISSGLQEFLERDYEKNTGGRR